MQLGAIRTFIISDVHFEFIDDGEFFVLTEDITIEQWNAVALLPDSSVPPIIQSGDQTRGVNVLEFEFTQDQGNQFAIDLGRQIEKDYGIEFENNKCGCIPYSTEGKPDTWLNVEYNRRERDN